MKDQTIEVLKKMAIKYSVVNEGESTSFTYNGTLTQRGRTHDKPKVAIDNGIADDIVEKNSEHDAIETITSELDVISE